MKRHRSPRWSAWRRAAAAVVASVILQLLALAAPASADDCTPQCSGKFCGDDGCGGTCGECVGTACVAGKCPVDSTFIPKQGCCDGNRLVRPAGQLIVVSSCSGMPSCGWDPGAWDSWGHPGAYACGTDGGEDPAGNAPKPCVIDCAGLCFGKECGPSGCGSSCGSCESEEVCIEGTCCLPDCEGRECGDDGCGGSCGAECPVGQGCSEAGQCCAPDCVGRQCGTDGCGGTCGSCTEGICLNGVCIYGCSGVTLQGCCLGEDAARCSSGELTLTECSSDAACGWKPSVGGYFCYHGHGGEEDPSGTYPIDCEIDCSQNCLGKECGSDGCGEGTCGECPAGDICVGGQCCTPDCEGKECGPDGCGGDCWYCDPDEQEVCQDGTCVPSWGCKNTSTAGCPGCACEECVCALEPTCCLWEWSYGCALVCEDECGGCAACEPDCTGAVCGSDGCGGSCGGCPPGYGCSEGQCCEQACEGKACGPDGCGGTCGTCAPGAVCDADLQCVQEHGCSATDTPGCGGCACEDCACELDPYCCDIEWDMACVGICEEECGGCGPTTCVPSCGGKTCGPDGCGGSCGECPAGALCRDGQCCTPDCSDGCGGPDGCGGDCGPESCGLGSFCEEGECKSLCAEECEGLECGVGTCGGPCGTGGAGCPQGHQVCLDGTCYNDCAGISPLAGCCDGSIAVACVLSGWHSDVMTTECGLSCGWKPEYDIGDETETGSYECGPPTPDPSGVHPMACDWSCKGPVCDPVAGSGPPMECGPDGCGGTCGECGAGEVCTRGACCTADLGDRECGPDACGAIVECEAGFRCSSPGLCVPCDDDPCQGRECGPDGCGGWCGICGYAEICASGVCLASCEGLSEKGCCSGDIHVWCNDSGWVFAEKCGPGANYCGWAQDAVDADGNPGGAYQCNTDGGVEPSGEHPKECFDVCAPA
ncbi:MAG: hypothetical protein FJ098_07580, partial [Deltaproteobacteria bacterium]|nr:hypothetical protein [Deltaproteobacteria bacterium]